LELTFHATTPRRNEKTAASPRRRIHLFGFNIPRSDAKAQRKECCIVAPPRAIFLELTFHAATQKRNDKTAASPRRRVPFFWN